MKVEIKLPLVGIQVKDGGRKFVTFEKANELYENKSPLIILTGEVLRNVSPYTSTIEVEDLDDSEYKQITGIDRRSPEEEDD